MMSKDTGIPEVLANLDSLTDLMRTEFKAQGERIARLEGRIEEQSRLLAALIPQKIAAVGDKKAG